MLFDEVVYFAREWIRTQTKVIRIDFVFLPQLIPALKNSPMRGAISDDPNVRFAARRDLRPGHKGARRLKLTVDALHVLFEIVGALTVL